MKRFGMAAIVMTFGAAPVMAGIPTTTSTSTTTVTSTSSTTSTSLPVSMCDDAATLQSITCRLDELSAAVAASPDLGSLGPKLDKALDKASNSVNLASEQCAQDDAKSAGKRLKKAIRRMIQFNHRLGSLKARKTVPDAVRTALLDAGKAIQDDLKALKGSLTCPQPGSPSGAFL